MLVVEMARRLRGSGVEVFLGCLDVLGSLGEDIEKAGFPVEVYGRKPGLDLGLPGRIARSVKRWDIDLVHAHQYTCFFYGALSKLRARRPLVFTEHGRFHPDVPSFRRRLFNALFSRLCDRVTAVSEGVKRSLTDIEGFDPRSIEVIYNGIDPGRFATCTKEEARRELEVPSGARVIGTVARLDPIKNQALLIRAFGRLRQELPDALLMIVGDGPEGGRLRNLAEQLRLDGSIRFLGERRNIDRILPAFDAFALSSLSEGTPMTLLEAMAASTPIVATAVGGIPEILGAEEAILVGARDGRKAPRSEESMEGDLAAGLRELLTRPDRAASMARKARERLIRDFTLDALHGKYLSIYRDLVGTRGP